MKYVLLILIFITCLFAQYDEPWIEVHNDSLTVGIYNMYRNCATEYVMNGQLQDTVFTFAAIDTAHGRTYCDCQFFVNAEFGGFAPGVYTANLYTYDGAIYDSSSNIIAHYDTVFIGTLNFTIIQNTANSMGMLSSYMSYCGEQGGQGIEEDEIPTQFALLNNYPNPFNTNTVLSYTLSRDEQIAIALFNMSGQLVDNIYQGYKKQGPHRIEYSFSGLASGVYIFQLSSQDFSINRKCLYLK